MTLAVLASQALLGLQAWPVRVEVHVGAGLPAFSLVGLPGAGVRESRERVRSAILSSGFEFPAGRITANLAPADVPKESGRFDLPIALGILLASGQIANPEGEAPDLRHYVFAGELSLTGAIAPATASLAIALAVAHGDAGAILVLAPGAAEQAAWVPGLDVRAARCLQDVVAHFREERHLPAAQPAPVDGGSEERLPCMADVRGQSAARKALEIAAAGGHSLLMSGSPGVGKSMLAQRLPGILPPLDALHALEVAAIHGLDHGDGGMAAADRPNRLSMPRFAPFRAPHHSATMAALVGGGALPRPGEISLAHRGVLFLDELPEFDRRALEALREPLETGHVTISRALGRCRFPARFQLVAAMNPCPCGWLGHPRRQCRCPPDQIERYRTRISGPLMDRIDLHVALTVESAWLQTPPAESSINIRQRVLAARHLQLDRQGRLNVQLESAQLDRHAQPDEAGRRLLLKTVDSWGWSARATQRVLRVARTLADLDGEVRISSAHVAQAIQFRPQ